MVCDISSVFVIFGAILWLPQNVESAREHDDDKRPLIVAAWKSEPYMYYNESVGFFKGIDYFLVETIAKHLQVDVQFVAANASSVKKADLIIGGLSPQMSDPQQDFSWSQPYFFQDDTTWCVRRAEQIPVWMNFFRIASPAAIIVGACLLIMCIYLAYGLTTFEDHPIDIWHSVISFVQGLVLTPFAYRPKTAVMRIFAMFCHIDALIVITIFSAFFYNFLLEPRYEPQIQTINQIVENGFSLGGGAAIRAYLEQNNLSTPQQSRSFLACANTSHCLSHLHKFENVAVAVSRQRALLLSSTFDRGIFCFSRSNNVRNYSMNILVRGRRLWMQRWNELIQRTIEGGLIEKWSRDVSFKPRKKEFNAGVRPFHLGALHGFLILYAILWILAISVFILELTVHRKLKQPNSHRIWKTIDWIIDGKRHCFQSKKRRPIEPQSITTRTYCAQLYPLALRQSLATSRRP